MLWCARRVVGAERGGLRLEVPAAGPRPHQGAWSTATRQGLHSTAVQAEGSGMRVRVVCRVLQKKSRRRNPTLAATPPSWGVGDVTVSGAELHSRRRPRSWRGGTNVGPGHLAISPVRALSLSGPQPLRGQEGPSSADVVFPGRGAALCARQRSSRGHCGADWSQSRCRSSDAVRVRLAGRKAHLAHRYAR